MRNDQEKLMKMMKATYVVIDLNEPISTNVGDTIYVSSIDSIFHATEAVRFPTCDGCYFDTTGNSCIASAWNCDAKIFVKED